MSNNSFSSLAISENLQKNMESLGFTEMTEVQTEALPVILKGKDVIAQAKTGSGKTVAFGLALIQNLQIDLRSPQGLILCPTRELANQVATVLRQLARMTPNVKIITICGGGQFRPQQKTLLHGAHLVVGTPGRIAKHLRKETLNLSHLKTLVLDEGDRMLEMGFQDEIDAVIAAAPSQRQTLLFSATFPEGIHGMADNILNNPIKIEVHQNTVNTAITEHFYQVENHHQKVEAVKFLISNHPESTVVFCNTKREAIELTDDLIDAGFAALDIHGDLEQRDREDTLIKFTNRSITTLVATDVAARGLDINAIEAVINFSLVKDVSVHVHRVGRTGRAGATGVAYSLFGERENYKFQKLQEFLGQTFEVEKLPEFPAKIIPPQAPMITLLVKIGKKQKLRAGNLLGLLTGTDGIRGDQVGKIEVQDHLSFVAIAREAAEQAIQVLKNDRWKNKLISVEKI